MFDIYFVIPGNSSRWIPAFLPAAWQATSRSFVRLVCLSTPALSFGSISMTALRQVCCVTKEARTLPGSSYLLITSSLYEGSTLASSSNRVSKTSLWNVSSFKTAVNAHS